MVHVRAPGFVERRIGVVVEEGLEADGENVCISMLLTLVVARGPFAREQQRQ